MGTFESSRVCVAGVAGALRAQSYVVQKIRENMYTY